MDITYDRVRPYTRGLDMACGRTNTLAVLGLLALLSLFSCLSVARPSANRTTGRDGPTIKVDICEPKSGETCVVVVGPDLVNPVPGAHVFLLSENGLEAAATLTDADGVARLRILPGTRGKWIMAAHANVASGVLWYPENDRYFIVMCPSAIP